MKRDRFTSTIVKRTKHGKVLIKNIYDSVNKPFDDHLWVDDVGVISKKQVGVVLTFTAEPYMYMSEYVKNGRIIHEMKLGLKDIWNIKSIGKDMKAVEEQIKFDRKKYENSF